MSNLVDTTVLFLYFGLFSLWSFYGFSYIEEMMLLRMPVVGLIAFVDGGCGDPKVVCSPRPLRAYERAGLELFFRYSAECGIIEEAPSLRFLGMAAPQFVG